MNLAGPGRAGAGVAPGPGLGSRRGRGPADHTWPRSPVAPCRDTAALLQGFNCAYANLIIFGQKRSCQKMIPFTKIRSLFNPPMYQGWGKSRKYFEGWYFKVVNAGETVAFAFIPGISMNESGDKQAFIQVLDGKKKTAEFYPFEASAFQPSPTDFAVNVAGNFFSAGRIKLELPAVTGELSFTGNRGWPNPWYSPGIMGPYTFAPFMECNHGIISMDHTISGSLSINGVTTDFTGGRGYTEKDWGHSFPTAYIWMQSNHFDAPGISFKASVARIPWLTGSFTGFISGFLFDNRLYSFTEYGGGRLTHLEVTGPSVEMEFRNRTHILNITAPKDTATALASPIKGLMGGRIEESMTSVITLTLSEKATGRIIFTGEGRNGSIEVSGDTKSLMPR